MLDSRIIDESNLQDFENKLDEKLARLESSDIIDFKYTYQPADGHNTERHIGILIVK